MVDEFIAGDFVAHDPPLPGVRLDRAGVKQAAEIFRNATPGTHEITMQVAEGDLAEPDGIAIPRIRDGKIVEH